MSDYLWDRTGPADLEVARLERVLGKLRQPQSPLRLPLYMTVQPDRPRIALRPAKVAFAPSSSSMRSS